LNSKFITILIIVDNGSESSKIENMVVGITFGPKREEVKIDWRKLHNEDLKFHSSLNIIRDRTKKSEMGGHVTHFGRRTEMCTWFWKGCLR
jgi:ABC-type antimicrobial peptide transport system ATPase subunit